MKYVAPYGSGDPNAPYVNGNPSTGQQGSIPPAAAFEHPLRELVAIIEKSGLTPTDASLLQAFIAIRSQSGNFRTAAGTANALTATLDPAPASYAAILGMPFRFVVTTTNNAAASLNLNGLGAQNIVYPGDNSNMLPGELIAGAIRTAMWDGANFQLVDAGSRVRGGVSFRGMRLIASTQSWNPATDGLTIRDRCLAFAWGPGGGGSANASTYGGGGGGGGLGIKSFNAPASAVTATLGTPGFGNNAGAAGGNGGTTSLGSIVSATGGNGATFAGGPGTGGVGVGGDVNLLGGDGGDVINDVIAFANGGAAPFMGNMNVGSTAPNGPIGSGGWARSNGTDAANGAAGAILIIW